MFIDLVKTDCNLNPSAVSARMDLRKVKKRKKKRLLDFHDMIGSEYTCEEMMERSLGTFQGKGVYDKNQVRSIRKTCND